MNARVALVFAAAFLFAGEAAAITLNYNNLPSSSSFQYTSQGVRQRHYNTNYTSSTGHYHRGGSSSNYWIFAHSSCCSSRMILDMPGTSASFVMGTLLVMDDNSSASWTGFLNGSVVWTAQATGGNGSTFSFPTQPIDELRLLVPTGGNYGWDNLTVNPCSPSNVSAGGPYSVDEGDTVTMNASGSGGSLNYLWDFDGGSGTGPYNDGTGVNAVLDTTVYGWDGPLTTTIGVEGNCGGSSLSDTTTVTVNNVAPTLTISTPATVDEGALTTFVGAGYDPGPTDQAALAYNWDWGDSTAAGTTSTPTHAWADEGTFALTVTVTDLAGDTDTVSTSMAVENVAPEFTSTPAAIAEEGVEYSYTPTVFDPGVNDLLTYSLGPNNPTGAAVAPLTGFFTWTPTYGDSGENTLSITVDDGDGGVTTQTWTATVDLEDADGDGMADGWELDNGLDPSDPADAALDPDGDGLTNVDEFDEGQDPNVFDGPGAPVATTPEEGTFILEFRPTLRWDEATDPNGDTLTYEVEVHDDAGLASLAISQAEINGLAWDLAVNLDENTEYHWRVRAHDGWTFGPWSNVLWFFVDTGNQAPEAPVPLYPIDGETVAELQPTPEWATGVDPDRDPLTYDIRVTDDNGALITQGSTTAARDTWTLDVALDEDSWYRWTVRAVDDEGLAGPWSVDERFFVSTANAAPSDVYFISPEDGESIGTQSPNLVATESVDPEGDEPVYHFTLDAEEDDGEDPLEAWIAHNGSGEVAWVLNNDEIELRANTHWVARVRAEDSGGVGGAWDQVTVFIRGANDAPPVPELISPEDGASVEVVEFVVGTVADPDGDPVTYRVRVARDEDFTDIVAFEENLEPDGDTLSWAPSSVGGTVYWTARAVDNSGVASAWAEPWSVTVGGPLAGCDNCEASLGGSASGATGIAILLALTCLGRRRRFVL